LRAGWFATSAQPTPRLTRLKHPAHRAYLFVNEVAVVFLADNPKVRGARQLTPAEVLEVVTTGAPPTVLGDPSAPGRAKGTRVNLNGHQRGEIIIEPKVPRRWALRSVGDLHILARVGQFKSGFILEKTDHPRALRRYPRLKNVVNGLYPTLEAARAHLDSTLNPGSAEVPHDGSL
jgi:hypothetical protein